MIRAAEPGARSGTRLVLSVARAARDSPDLRGLLGALGTSGQRAWPGHDASARGPADRLALIYPVPG